jgi:hypothetical protein
VLSVRPFALVLVDITMVNFNVPVIGPLLASELFDKSYASMFAECTEAAYDQLGGLFCVVDRLVSMLAKPPAFGHVGIAKQHRLVTTNNPYDILINRRSLTIILTLLLSKPHHLPLNTRLGRF